MKKLDENTKVLTLENTYKLENSQITKFEIESNQTLTIIEIVSDDSELSKELIVGENATLNYIKIGTKENNANRNYTNTIAKNGTLNLTLLEYGSSQNSINTKLNCDDSTFTINGLLDLKDDAKVSYDVQTNHQAKSTSDVAFKNLLDGKSFVKLNMFSIVEKNASFSKAFQNSKTLLLSDDSSIAVTPHLEISIDELEASHGATCGDLDKDSIYYLQSRGISEDDAKKIVLDAIRDEVVASVENEQLSEYIKGLL